MSDLRDRIAAVLWNRKATCACDRCVECCEADADAVIRELRLHIVTVGDFQKVIKGSYPKPLEKNGD